jgi:hypothetical protein
MYMRIDGLVHNPYQCRDAMFLLPPLPRLVHLRRATFCIVLIRRGGLRELILNQALFARPWPVVLR